MKIQIQNSKQKPKNKIKIFKKGVCFIMTMIKRIAALMAVAMLLVMTAVPTFAAGGAPVDPTLGSTYSAVCDATHPETSIECQLAKALGNGVSVMYAAKDAAVNAGYAYDVQVAINGKTYTVWLKSRPEVDNFNVNMGQDGQLNVMGIGTGDSNQWNNLFGKYRTVVVGISGVGAITMIVFFIINFMKLGSSAGNPQARSQALTGVLWTGLAAAGLGAVSIIAGFFYNAL